MNAPFDYVAYLDDLQSVGLNLTRLFSGVYCEAAGDFNIKDNTLAPGRGNLLCPFARSAHARLRQRREQVRFDPVGRGVLSHA